MKIKMTAGVLLPMLLVGAASAQMATILPGGQGNLYVGLPTSLPGPLPNPLISTRIGLPSPLLTPTLIVSLTPALAKNATALPSLPKTLPTIIPAVRVTVASPVLSLSARFAAAEQGAASSENASREKNDSLFDGRKDPEKPAVELPKTSLPEPIRTSRHVSLPEHDLESEIGAY